jgi:acetyl esterase/lipase
MSALPSLLRRAAVLISLVGLLGGCSTFGVLNTLEPKSGVVVIHDQPYGARPRQRLDVYAPIRPAPGRPVVVFFYGGSWDTGSKADYAWVGQALAQQGYVVVVPDYRVYPAAVWPAFLQDSAKAVRWAKDHAGATGGDVSRLVLMGHSAGAYNAVDLAVDGRWLQAVGMDPRKDLAAVVGLSGPYDFLPVQTDELKTIFGPEEKRPDTQPINHIRGAEAPMLLATGDKDTVVDPGNTERMAAMLRAHDDKVQTIHYPKLDHAKVVGAIAEPLRWIAPVLKDVSRYIDAQTGFRREN